jgi:hypothetical protein
LLLESEMLNKYNDTVSSSVLAIAHSFKTHFLEYFSALSEGCIRYIVVKYSNSNGNSNGNSNSNGIRTKEYDFSAFADLLKELDEKNEKNDKAERLDKYGAVAAVNSLANVKFRDDAMRFVFHFCGGESKDKGSDNEVDAELRSKDFKYEIVFFDENVDKRFFEMVADVIAADVNKISTGKK